MERKPPPLFKSQNRSRFSGSTATKKQFRIKTRGCIRTEGTAVTKLRSSRIATRTERNAFRAKIFFFLISKRKLAFGLNEVRGKRMVQSRRDFCRVYNDL